MLFVTDVHMVGGVDHRHIGEVKWSNPTDGKTGSSSRAEMVEFIGEQKGDARVKTGSLEVEVRVIKTRARALVHSYLCRRSMDRQSSGATSLLDELHQSA